MKITIMQFEPNGMPDKDMSIHIPENCAELTVLHDTELSKIIQSNVQKHLFEEKVRKGTKASSFPSLKMDNWYFVWIDEVSSWIAIYFYSVTSDESFGSPVEVDNTISCGPYDIGLEGAKIIKKHYNSNLPLEKIKNTSPDKL